MGALPPPSRYLREFTEIEKLGSGGFGTVYKVQHKLDGKKYAMKKIKLSNDKWQLVMNEIQILARLDNPHVVKYKNTFHEGGLMYIQMELAQMTLHKWLTKRNNRPEDFNRFFKQFIHKGSHFNALGCNGTKTNAHLLRDLDKKKFDFDREALKIGKQLAGALHYIHQNRIIHNDIKPENIFINSKDCAVVVQLADFGLANIFRNSPQPLGTLLYAAPEKSVGKGGRRSDIFSLGLVLLELLMSIRSYNHLVEVFKKARRGKLCKELCHHDRKLIWSLLDEDPCQRPYADTLKEILKYFIDHKIDDGHSKRAEDKMYRKWPEIFY